MGLLGLRRDARCEEGFHRFLRFPFAVEAVHPLGCEDATVESLSAAGAAHVAPAFMLDEGHRIDAPALAIEDAAHRILAETARRQFAEVGIAAGNAAIPIHKSCAFLRCDRRTP